MKLSNKTEEIRKHKFDKGPIKTNKEYERVSTAGKALPDIRRFPRH